MDNKKIIFFPKPKVQLTEEETVEYDSLKKKLDKAKTLRELFFLRKEVNTFLKNVYKRRKKR